MKPSTGFQFLWLRAPFEWLTNALRDPGRAEWRVVALIVEYVAAWTLYGVLAKGSHGIHFDMAELADWGHHPLGGYYKHPPLAAWVVSSTILTLVVIPAIYGWVKGRSLRSV